MEDFGRVGFLRGLGDVGSADGEDVNGVEKGWAAEVDVMG